MLDGIFWSAVLLLTVYGFFFIDEILERCFFKIKTNGWIEDNEEDRERVFMNFLSLTVMLLMSLVLFKSDRSYSFENLVSLMSCLFVFSSCVLILSKRYFFIKDYLVHPSIDGFNKNVFELNVNYKNKLVEHKKIDSLGKLGDDSLYDKIIPSNIKKELIERNFLNKDGSYNNRIDNSNETHLILLVVKIISVAQIQITRGHNKFFLKNLTKEISHPINYDRFVEKKNMFRKGRLTKKHKDYLENDLSFLDSFSIK